MGLFGPSKREQEMQAEIVRLQGLLGTDGRIAYDLQNEITALTQRRQELENNISKLQQDFGIVNNNLYNLNLRHQQLLKQIATIEDTIEIQSFGVYQPTYKFANSDMYKERLQVVRNNQKEMIKNGTACVGNMSWSVNGSITQGRKMVKDMQKLLLRAFNVECDNVVSNVKVSNFTKSKERILKLSEQISKLGAVMSISISSSYVNYKLEEISLALDFEQKKQEEKERIREARELQKEEAKIKKEIEEERKKLTKEQSHYQNALIAVIEQLQKKPDDTYLLTKKKELEANINDTRKAIADVDYREANKKAGYVYIISNIGAFGENIYKIGMTRRLEPHDRIDELSSASVPFKFDVHALIFSEDAPKLEAALHRAFEDKKVNKINSRREFFKVTLSEIKSVVRQNFDKTVEWIDVPEAEQFRQSLSLGSTLPIINTNLSPLSTEPTTSQEEKLATKMKTDTSHLQQSQPFTPTVNIPPNYCICCKRSGKFMQINNEHMCPMCADTASEEQKLNAKREAGLI